MPMTLDVKNLDRDQYLAVSVFKDEHLNRNPSLGPFAANYSLQIWNCGKLNNSVSVPTAPFLKLLLVHSYGRVWSLAWCPSGCYDESRLGVLAASFSDGTVRVFGIPHPQTLRDDALVNAFLV